jgi:hypothetical protein
MRKMLPLNNLSKYGTGFLIPAYFMMALVPIGTLIPEVHDVQNVSFSECHKSCHVENGTEHCTKVCSGNSTVITSQQGKSRAVIRGSTGPTHPPKPVGTQGNKH